MADTPTIYIVTKIRTVPNGDSVAALIEETQHLSRTSAESRYYSVLAAAANDANALVSSGVLMTNEGFVIESKSYTHEIQPPAPKPEPEPEPEPEPNEGE